MNINKIRLLENSYDVCGGSKKEGMGFIYDASTPKGKCPLFKTLQSNKCSYDCKYCSNSKGCNKTKARYEPEELASIFNHLNKKLAVHGLFLSSGVAGDPDKVTEKMIKAVKLLRYKYSFKGYVHFKVLPGTTTIRLPTVGDISYLHIIGDRIDQHSSR